MAVKKGANMKKILLLSLLVLSSAYADTTIPFQTVFCNNIQRIEKWNYTQSYNTYNGRRDRTGMISVKMTGISDRGGRLIVTHTFPVHGLRWNHDFTQLSFGDSVCPSKGRFRIRAYPRNCEVNFRLVTATVNQTQTYCAQGQRAVTLQGQLRQNNS